MSQDNSHFEDVFRKALQNHETPVSPKVWAGVQSSLASGAGAATGSAILGKAAAVIGFAALITAATISEVQHATSHTAKAVVETEAITIASETPAAAKYGAKEATEISTEQAPDQTSTVNALADQSIESARQPEVTVIETAEADRLKNDVKSRASFSEKVDNGKPQIATSASGIDDNESLQATENEATGPDKEAVKASAPKVKVNEIKQDDEPVVAKTTAYFTHPAESIFTPNGDGFHDYFEVEGHGVQNFNIRIMNRSGNVVFESTDIHFKWNGNNRFGEPSPSGVYFFVIEAVGQDGLPYLEPNAKGSVTLKR